MSEKLIKTDRTGAVTCDLLFDDGYRISGIGHIRIPVNSLMSDRDRILAALETASVRFKPSGHSRVVVVSDWPPGTLVLTFRGSGALRGVLLRKG